MFEKYMILTQEFQNVRDSGGVIGFQVKVRLPYYRGVWLSTIHHLELKVDDESFPQDRIDFCLGNRRFTTEQREDASNVRWFFGDPATLVVNKPGGLSSGMHRVYFSIGWRHSYVPFSDPQHVYGFPPGVAAALDAPTATSKHMTLVL
jgi:hypothetical protein